MRTTFKEYYRIDDKDAKKIWEDGIIVVDTNILLNLYRYSKDTSDDVIRVLKSLKERLWLPYQVCYEFHENRLDRYYESWNAADSIKKKLSDQIEKFTKDVENQFSRNPFVKIDELNKVVKKNVDRIFAKIDEWKTSVNDFVTDDKILDEITSLYDGKVGPDFDEERLKSIYKEGESRYKVKCPPGYKDDTSDKQAAGPRHVYGDLVLWKQLMEYAKGQNKDVVFISDDQKDDWWVEWKGKKIYPQPCLVREFQKETNGKRIIFYNQKQFLNFARNVLDNKTKESTIKEIEEIELAQLSRDSIVWGDHIFYGGGYPQYILGISPKENVELRALSGLTEPCSLSGITASQEILQSAMHISELAKPFAGISRISPDYPEANFLLFGTEKPVLKTSVSPFSNKDEDPTCVSVKTKNDKSQE